MGREIVLKTLVSWAGAAQEWARTLFLPRIPACAGRMLLAGMLLLGAAPALSQEGADVAGSGDVELICPCTVEPVADQPNSVRVMASIRNYDSKRRHDDLILTLRVQRDGRVVRGGEEYINPPVPHDFAVGPVDANSTKGVNEIVELSPYFFTSVSDIKKVLSLYLDKGGIDGGKGGVIFPDLPSVGLADPVTSIDYLADDDGDGVSDYNERLMKTRPEDPDDKPGTVTLNIMGLYPADLGLRYSLEPMACMVHSVEWADMALRNSRIDARYRLVKTKEIEGTLPVQSGDILDQMKYQQGPFMGIDAERVAAGADLLVMFNATGGAATMPPLEMFESDPEGARREARSVVACGFNDILAHELGHNLGLFHSAKEEGAYAGHFRWSRGHGEDGGLSRGLGNERGFVTVMAGPAAYDTHGNNSVQFYSNPNLNLCGKKNSPCGVERDQPLAADAALSIRTMMYKVAQWAKDPPDEDEDGLIDFIEGSPRYHVKG